MPSVHIRKSSAFTRTTHHVVAIGSLDIRADRLDTGFYCSKEEKWKTLKKSMHR